MPKKSQTIAITGYDAARLQAIAYGALEQLGWTVKYAAESILLAYTPKSWTKYDNEILVKTQDNELTVTSKMIHGEAFDIMGRNKKFIAEFLAAFEMVRAKATDLNTGEWKQKIELLEGETLKVAGQEIKQAEEADKVMNFSKGNLYVTYGIVAINVLVFVLMVGSGVSIFSPTGIDIIKWGANFGPLTLSGDWWRLISCVFVHIGIIHIAFNMYALYMAGVYLEPLLGKTKYIAAYLCTGVFASLASLWWHKDPIASAGASGAIFGMYGIFLALLSTNLIPKQIRKGLLQSIGVFVIYNLVYGIKSGVDNSAHIGGLLSGLLIGYLYYPGLKSPGKKSLTLVGVIAVATAGSTIFYLQNNKAADETRSRAKEEIEEYEYKDADKYREQLKIFGEAEKKALAPFGDTTLTYQEKVEKLQSFSLPEWEKASEAIERIKSLKVSDKSKQKGEKVQQYISLRKEEIRLIGQLALKEDEGMATQLEAVKNKIHQLIVELKGL